MYDNHMGTNERSLKENQNSEGNKKDQGALPDLKNII